MRRRSFAVRIAVLVTGLLVATQALATGGTVMVCRYTGRSLSLSDCPGTRAEKPSAAAQVRAESCCEFRQIEAACPVGVTQSRDQGLQSVWYPAVPVAAHELRTVARRSGARARNDEPPGDGPLYLALRTLLI
jgi:hypothetical protein